CPCRWFDSAPGHQLVRTLAARHRHSVLRLRTGLSLLSRLAIAQRRASRLPRLHLVVRHRCDRTQAIGGLSYEICVLPSSDLLAGAVEELIQSGDDRDPFADQFDLEQRRPRHRPGAHMADWAASYRWWTPRP